MFPKLGNVSISGKASELINDQRLIDAYLERWRKKVRFVSAQSGVHDKSTHASNILNRNTRLWKRSDKIAIPENQISLTFAFIRISPRIGIKIAPSYRMQELIDSYVCEVDQQSSRFLNRQMNERSFIMKKINLFVLSAVSAVILAACNPAVEVVKQYDGTESPRCHGRKNSSSATPPPPLALLRQSAFPSMPASTPS
jgi:hypothetical protein